MSNIDWNRDWSKASIDDLAWAADSLSNSLGGDEQRLLEAVTEQLWRLHDLER